MCRTQVAGAAPAVRSSEAIGRRPTATTPADRPVGPTTPGAAPPCRSPDGSDPSHRPQQSLLTHPAIQTTDRSPRQWTRGVWTRPRRRCCSRTDPTVQGAHAHLNLDRVWPFTLRCSESPGSTAATSRADRAAARIDPACLQNAMTTEQFVATLGAMTAGQFAVAVPHGDSGEAAR